VSHKFTSVERANARYFGILKTSLGELEAHLQALDDQKTHNGVIGDYALKEAKGYAKVVHNSLFHSSPGLRWVSQTGYLNVWSMLHRVEEALLEVDLRVLVFREALRDRSLIQYTDLPKRDDLLHKQKRALQELEPLESIYFEDDDPWEGIEKRIDELKELIQSNLPNNEALHPDKQQANSEKTKPPASVPFAILRGVRYELNTFRDSRWEKILQLRNQLIRSLALTAIATYLLLCLVILTAVPRDAVIAAAAFYMIGAISGLFGRFFGEADHSTLNDEYGLSLARLVATPLFSGLAGIGGAFVTVVLSILSGHQTSQPTLLQIFQIQPLNLFIAAVFGLTPNLLMHSLQKQAESFKPEGDLDKTREQATNQKAS
jgi:hypothetical protein